MNEQIKELARQSQMVFWPTDPEVVELSKDIDIEKFAELLIRECAQVCRDQPNHYALKADRDNCAIAIEEHFGVEE